MIDVNLFGDIRDPVALAIERLKTFEPPEGYFLAFGGGKDSVVLLELAKRSGVKFDAHYHNVTIEPPELVRFVRDAHPEVEIDRPAKTFFQLVPEKGFPLRHRRWCCAELKEIHGGGRFVLLGVRWQESVRRRSRKMVEVCSQGRQKRYLSPIVDWTTDQVWQFIRSENLPYCSLYDEGFKRLGCIACPMQSSDQRKMELARWPKFRAAFLLAFSKLIADRQAKGKWNTRQWPDAEHLLAWWLSITSAAPKDQQWFDYE
jgi:phosphoadenosine phosphosulfate reductase